MRAVLPQRRGDAGGGGEQPSDAGGHRGDGAAAPVHFSIRIKSSTVDSSEGPGGPSRDIDRTWKMIEKSVSFGPLI